MDFVSFYGGFFLVGFTYIRFLSVGLFLCLIKLKLTHEFVNFNPLSVVADAIVVYIACDNHGFDACIYNIYKYINIIIHKYL